MAFSDGCWRFNMLLICLTPTLLFVGSCAKPSKTTTDTFCLAYEGIRQNKSDRDVVLICALPKPGDEAALINPKACLKQPRIRPKTQRGIDRNNAKKLCCMRPDLEECR